MKTKLEVNAVQEIVSRSVGKWFRHYEVDPDKKAVATLVRVAGELYAEGYWSANDLSTCLIGTYIGRWSLMVNAPTSASLH